MGTASSTLDLADESSGLAHHVEGTDCARPRHHGRAALSRSWHVTEGYSFHLKFATPWSKNGGKRIFLYLSF